MADSISMDMSEVHRLAADFGRASRKVLPLVDAVVKKGADNIKREMALDAKASPHFKAVAGSISYDRAYSLGSVGYEVGPDIERRGGPLGHIFYFGGINGGGGTGDLDKPLRSEAPRLEKALGSVLDGLLE